MTEAAHEGPDNLELLAEHEYYLKSFRCHSYVYLHFVRKVIRSACFVDMTAVEVASAFAVAVRDCSAVYDYPLKIHPVS